MIPQPFTLAIPTLFAALAGWLRAIGLPRWANYGILFGFFVLAVFFSIIGVGGLTGDPWKDFYIVTGVCAAIFAILKPMIDTMTVAFPSPFSQIAARRIAAQKAREEEAAWEAAKKSRVPPRASAAQPGGVVDGAGRALYSQPGIDPLWEPPEVDAMPTVAELPAMPPPPPHD